ncbi:putative nucleotidyltransferase, ribonuclease H [Tanacetum coccineum]
MPEDSRVPIILGRPFLETTRAMIDVFNKKITLRVGDDERTGKTIDQSDLEYCESTDRNNDDDSDSKNPIWRINSVNTPYQVAQDITEHDEVKSEHLYLANANEIDEKKPELKNLPQHLEYAFLYGDKSFPVIISSKLSENEKMSLLQVLEKRNGAVAWKMSDIKGISPSYYSSWVSLIHFVPKKGWMTVVLNDNNKLIPSRTVTGWRVCIDYRKLNDATRKDHFPLPFIDQMLERLCGNEYYCFLDGFSGFFQIPIAPEDQEKTTFTCPYGTFAYRRMPFGLCNAPATFQRCMTAIFHDMVEDFMEVFMDDFSVFGNSFDCCLANLDRMLSRCEETNLVLNWEKCHFMVKEGIVLGHKIFGAGIEVDRAKIDVIAKLPYPTNVKGVRSFLGHAGFYRRFIKDFSMISKPMTQLLMKDAKFDFSDDCKKAFNILKEKLTTAPIIISPDWNVPFKLMCDASDFVVGAVLGSRIDGKFKPIYYASKTLNNSQEHYTTTEKELLVVVFSFDKFRQYLVLSKTVVYTDQSALKYLFSKQDAKPRLIRWVLLLQGFDIEIKDKKGAENLAADHLSRLENPDLGTFTEEEITDEFLDEHLMILKAELNSDQPCFVDYVNYIVGKIVPPNWTPEKRRFFSQVKNYFWDEPYTFKFCSDNVMRSASITGRKVYESGLYWPNIFKDAKDYVMRCDACQRSGNISSRSEMPQNNIQVCDIFDIRGLDFIGPFSNSKRNKYILVVVDYVSKWVKAQALPTNDARVVIRFLRRLFARFKVPKALISDRGTHFCNSQLENALQKYEVTHKLSTTYHPQTNGQTEVTNRAIKRILERSVGYNPKNWPEKLDDALWAFRTAYKTPTGCTPFRLVYGKACHLPVEIENKAYWALKQCNMDLTTAAKNRFMELNELMELRDGAYENTWIYKERTKRWHDSRLRGDKNFKEGDKVLLFNSRFKMHPGKLKSKWYGPNMVKTVYPYRTVEIIYKNEISFKVNGQRLKKYHDGYIDAEEKEVVELDEDKK